MTRKNTNTKKNTNDYGFAFANTVVLRGVIRKINFSSDKVAKYNIDVPSETPNGNICHAFLNVTEFTTDGALDEGTKVHIEGYISTGSYEDKNGNKRYTTDVIATSIKEIED